MLFLLFEIWPLVYKTVSSFSGSVILRNRPFKFPFPIVLNLTDCRKCIIFCGKMFENRSELHGGDRKHIKVCKTIKISISNFSPLCQLQSSISQNRSVRLVPCFVGVHHIILFSNTKRPFLTTFKQPLHLNFIPLWEWTWHHCVFYVRVEMRTVFSSQ